MEAVRAGCHGLHLTVNGMGERAGNTPMASTVAALKDFLPGIEININESSLHKVSKLVATFTGFRIPVNKPVVGQNVFTQTAGIHADGDKKNLYFNDLLLNASEEQENMPWVKPPEKPTFKKTYRSWGSPSMMRKSKK